MKDNTNSKEDHSGTVDAPYLWALSFERETWPMVSDSAPTPIFVRNLSGFK